MSQWQLVPKVGKRSRNLHEKPGGCSSGDCGAEAYALYRWPRGAVLVNAGNANCATGQAGIDACVKTCVAAAETESLHLR